MVVKWFWLYLCRKKINEKSSYFKSLFKNYFKSNMLIGNLKNNIPKDSVVNSFIRFKPAIPYLVTMSAAWSSGYSAVSVIDIVSVQNLLAPFCCYDIKDTFPCLAIVVTNKVSNSGITLQV